MQNKQNSNMARVSCGRIAFYPLKADLTASGRPIYDITNGWIINNIVKIAIKPETSTEIAYGSGKALLLATKNNGGEIEIETYYLPLELKAKLFGKEFKNGMLQESADDVPIDFGLAVENAIYSNGKREWGYFGKCTLTPGESDLETSEDKVKFQSDTYSIRYLPVGVDNITRATIAESELTTKEEESIDKTKMLDNIYLYEFPTKVKKES